MRLAFDAFSFRLAVSIGLNPMRSARSAMLAGLDELGDVLRAKGIGPRVVCGQPVSKPGLLSDDGV